MKLLTFAPSKKDAPRLGALSDGLVIDANRAISITNASKRSFSDVGALLSGDKQDFALVKRSVEEARRYRDEQPEMVFDQGSVVYYPPILLPRKLLCVAVNYRSHAVQGGSQVLEEPYVFIKLSETVIGSGWPIVLSKSSRQCDNEIELAVVIGKEGKYITRQRAEEHIAGYTIFNDVSFRDRRVNKSDPTRMNWLHLKSLDSAAPMGPWMVTKEEIPDPYSLEISVEVNGGDRQTGSTSDMVHKIPEVIEYISNGITLKPGDVIATGTPLGIASQRGRWLQEGDVVEGAIDGIGKLVNPVKGEP